MRHPLLFLCVAWGSLASDAYAHDLKVLASRLTLDRPGKTTIYLSWGHLLPVDELLDAKSIERYEVLGPKDTVALTAAGVSLHANSVTLQTPGLYQAIVSRKPTLLTWVIDADGNRVMRRGPRDSIKDAKIDVALRSQMFGKAVIVADKAGETLSRPVGLPLEIVPLEPPAQWKAGARLRVQVLHQGKPLAGAEVHATYVGHRAEDGAATTKTNAEGQAELHTRSAAVWVLKVQHRVPSTGAARNQYDYEALTSTLALEVLP
jgi:uncharacterized GH25 family protein